MSNLFTSFSMNERECRVLQLKRQKNNLKIEKFFTIMFEESTEEEAEIGIQQKADILKKALKERKCRIGECVLLIPKRYVTVRHAFLPSVDDAELVQMARFEAEKHIHFHQERHIISHHVMKKEGVSGSHVLISAADTPVIDEPLSVLTAAGILPGVSTASSVGLFNLFHYLNPDINEETTYALIHIGNFTIDLAIIHKGILVFTRSTSHGINKLLSSWNAVTERTEPIQTKDIENIDILEPDNYFSPAPPPDQFPPDQPFLETEGEEASPPEPIVIIPKEKSPPKEVEIFNEWKAKLIQSIRQTYDFARREFDCPPIDKIFLSGEGAQFQGIIAYLSKNLGVEVETMELGEAITVDQALPSGYFPVLGGALDFVHDKGVHLNLLPPHYIEKQLNRQKRQNIISLGVMILGVLILGVLYLRAYNLKQKKLTTWYTKEINLMKTRVTELADMEKKTSVIKSYVQDERNALAILDRISLYPYMPKSVSITSFKYRKDEYVEISGHALSIKELNRFIKDLERSYFFRSVNIKQRPWVPLGYNRPKVLNYTVICSFEE